MRLLESRLYRGKKIRVYLTVPEGGGRFPVLAVRVDGAVLENTPHLSPAAQLSDALRWAQAATDRLLGARQLG